VAAVIETVLMYFHSHNIVLGLLVFASSS